MTKDEFREFCHNLLTSRGFRKKGKNRYYLNGDKRILCCIDLQKSMSEGYYLNYTYFIGIFKKIKDFPPPYSTHFALYSRIIVPQKEPGMIKYDPQTALIAYEFYTEEDLSPHLNEWLDKIMLPVKHGKQFLLKHLNEYSDTAFYQELFLNRFQQDEKAEQEEKTQLQD